MLGAEGADPGSPRSAVTSLTIDAPASRAASATASFEVSIETAWPARARRRPPARCARSPPLRSPHPRRAASTRRRRRGCRAPSRRQLSHARSPLWASRKSPPSENESGVTLTHAHQIGFTDEVSLLRIATNSELNAGDRARGTLESGGYSQSSRADIRDGRCPVPGREVPPAEVPRAALAGVAAGVARARPRHRPRALALGPFRLRRRLDRLRRLLLVDEDLVLGLAVEQGDELLGVDRLRARAGSWRSGRAPRACSVSRSLAVWWAASTMRRISSSISRAISSE